MRISNLYFYHALCKSKNLFLVDRNLGRLESGLARGRRTALPVSGKKGHSLGQEMSPRCQREGTRIHHCGVR